MKKFYVYIHTCPNEKKYVGITIRRPEYRWRKGNGYKSNKHFYRAIQKYGWDNIDHQVIEVDTENEMYYLEKYLIAYYQTNKNEFGYNKSSGGEVSSAGCHRLEEVRKKISESQKGRHLSIEIRHKMKGRIPWNKGKTLSEETKKKISTTKKGKNHSEEAKIKISESLKGNIPWNKGKHLSEETKAKMKGRIPWNKGLKKELV